jgi:hypothetical protein
MNKDSITFSREEVSLLFTLLKKEQEEQKRKFDTIFDKLNQYSKAEDTISTQSNIAVESKNDSPIVESKSLSNNSFPKDSIYTDKLLNVFQQHLKHASKYSEIKKIFTKITGLSKNIRLSLRKLRDTNQIVCIQFNEINTYVYYGLPEWVIETEKGYEFKEPFTPTALHLKIEVWKGEILTGQ